MSRSSFATELTDDLRLQASELLDGVIDDTFLHRSHESHIDDRIARRERLEALIGLGLMHE